MTSRPGVKVAEEAFYARAQRVTDRTCQGLFDEMSIMMTNAKLSVSKSLSGGYERNAVRAETGPKDEDNLGSKNQRLRAFSKKFLSPAKRIFVHVLLFGVVVGYLAIGAVAFSSIERDSENAARDFVLMEKQNILKSLFGLVNDNATHQNGFDTNQTLIEILNNFTMVINYGNKYGLDAITIGTDKESNHQWSLLGGYFFSFSLLTTIGYGNISPKTQSGRIFCIFYSLFGIPMMFLCLADLGSILAGFLKFLFFKVLPSLKHKISQKKTPCDLKKSTIGHVINTEMKQPATKSSLKKSLSASKKLIVPTRNSKKINFPIILVMLFVLLYMSLLSLYISCYVNWGFFESFYFSYITLTTIGLGDVLPEYHTMDIVSSTMLVLLGMVVMSASFNLAQHKVHDSINCLLVKKSEVLKKDNTEDLNIVADENV